MPRKKYVGPEGEPMLGWGDLYALMDDLCAARLPDGTTNYIGWLLAAILNGEYENARDAIAAYNLAHSPP